jgi:hypothetical protein
MSTKTSFKRVALVAVAALTIGGFSAVSAHAAALTSASIGSGGTGIITSSTAAFGSVTQASYTTWTATLTVTAITSSFTASGTDLLTLGGTYTPSVAGTATASIGALTRTTNTATSQIFTAPVTFTATAATSTAVALASDTYTTALTLTSGGTAAQAVTSSPSFIVPANIACTGWTVKSNGLTNSINLKEDTANTDVSGTAVKVNFGADMTSLPVQSNAALCGTQQFSAYLSTYPASAFTAVSAFAAGTPTAITGLTTTVTSPNVFLQQTNQGVVNAAVVTASSTAGLGTFKFTPAKAGTYVLTVWNDVNGDGNVQATEAVQTTTVVVTAPAGLAVPLSSAFMTEPSANGATANSTSNALPRSAAKAANTGIAQVKVTLLNTDGTAATAANTITATVSGSGFVSVDTTANTPGSPVTRTATDSTGASIRYVHINSDGTAGTGSVTVTVTDAASGAISTLGTFKYTSTGSIATLSISTTKYTIGKAGGGTTGDANGTRISTTVNPAFIVKAVDATGAIANAASAPTIVSSNTVVVASGVCNLDDGSSSDYSTSNGVGYYNCSFTTAATAKSGDTATLTARIVNPADSTTYLTATYVVTVGGSPAVETLTLDKASYAPGDAMVITQKAVDASGNPVYDRAAAPAITSNKTVGGSLSTGGVYVGGMKVSAANSVYAPATGGTFILTETSSNAAGDIITATATVTGDTTLNASIQAALDAANAAADAAAEATDAANAATDAANAAADAADSATAAAQDAADQAGQALAAVNTLATSVAVLIAGIKAQLTSVTNLVIKLIKRVAKLPIKK